MRSQLINAKQNNRSKSKYKLKLQKIHQFIIQSIDIEDIIQKNKQQKMDDKDNSSHIVKNIIAFSQEKGDLLNKYNIDFILGHFDRNTILDMTDHIQPHSKLFIEDFIRVFLLKITHTEDQTLYLALSLKKLYEVILQRTSNETSYIEFSDFTNYLCEKISKEDLEVVIPPKKINKQDQYQEIQNGLDLNPTIIISKFKQQIPKISKDVPKKNKKLQEKKGVTNFFYSKTLQKILALGSLTSSIYFYDNQLRERTEIKPRLYKQMEKEVSFLSMSYSSKNDRVGAILTNGMMAFWQGCDQFTTQKYISTRNCGDKIYFLQLLNEWVTVSKSTLYFWNLKEELISHTIVCEEANYITDICEMNHLRSICVSAVTHKEEKYLFIYHDSKRVAKINLGNTGCHTLHYNLLTQSLIPLGYHNSVPVYTVNGVEFDTQLKFVLRGHKSIITCIDSIEENTLMITGDDIGQIRIWQLSYMRCIQSLKLTKWLGKIKLIGNKLFYSDSRINLMELDHFQIKNIDKSMPVYQFYDQIQEIIWIITRKDARKIDIKTGKIIKIFTLCNEEEQISAAIHLGDGFVIGKSKGEICRYDSDCNLKWTKQAHQAEIKQLLYDHKNRLIFSLGSQGKIVAWPEKNTQEQRKTIIFKKKQINFFKISSKSSILLAGNTDDKELIIWNYEILKLYQVLSMQSGITCAFISEIVDLIIVGTSDLQIHLFKFSRKEHNLDLTLIYTIDGKTTQNYLLQKDKLNDIQLLSLKENTEFKMLISTLKGKMAAIDITSIINQHFLVKETIQYQSVNILRNQKQEFQTSFVQRGHIQHIQDITKECLTVNVQVIWINKLTNQKINCLSSITISDNLFGILCQDYYKLINIEDGSIMASLNINQTFPIKWNFQINTFYCLKKNIFQILKILDDILKNHGYQMLAKQYKMINITKFMENITNSTIGCKNNVETKNHLSQSTIKRNKQQVEPTLKALQAYKRVKQIKKLSEQSMYFPTSCESLKKKQTQNQKDQIAQLFINQTNIQVNNRSFLASTKNIYIQNLSAKLTESVILKQNKSTKMKIADLHDKKNLSTKENASDDKATKQLSSVRQVITDLKQNMLVWQKHIQSKNIKQILGNLNTKLKNCRLKYNRTIDS